MVFNDRRSGSREKDVNGTGAKEAQSRLEFIKMKTAYVDFETEYDKQISVVTMGNYNYAHATGDVYLVSIQSDDLGIDFTGRPEAFGERWKEFTGADLISHNANFDASVAIALVDKGIIPSFAPASWECSADLVACMGLPRQLAKASRDVLGIEVDKSIRNNMVGKTWQDVVDEGREQELLDYAAKDTAVMAKLWQQLSPEWSAFERQVSAMTRKMQMRGVAIDQEYLAKAEASLLAAREVIYSVLPWVPTAKPLSKPACIAHCAEIGITPPTSFDRTKPAYLAWERKHKDNFAFINARRDLQNLNKMLKNVEKLKLRIRPDGRIESSFKYFGAHTGRFAGEGGINLQNLEKDEKFGIKMRHLFVPAEGHKFVIVDAAQIEARIMSWMAGDEKMLQQLRDGVPLYEAHARMCMGWKGGVLKQENPKLYAQAKVKVLSLNYGCGAERFKSMAWTQYGVKMTMDEAVYAHRDYRDKNPLITSFWRARNNELYSAMRAQKDLTYDLPSGRVMRWREPKIDGTGRDITVKTLHSKSGDWYRTKTYGGKLTENVIQAIARDILCHHMLEIEKHYPIVMTIHDEVVCEVPEDQADKALADIIGIMSTAPSWASTCPLNAEGGVHAHYDK
jgi:DNA polymerase